MSSFGLLMLSFGPLCLRLAHPNVLRPFVLSCGQLCHHSAIPSCCDLGQWRRGMRGGRKQATTEVMAHFCDALPVPPMSWVPPLVTPTPSHCPPLSEAHIPQWRGGAPVGLSEVVGNEVGQRGGGGGGGVKGGINQHQPLMRLMFDSNSAFSRNDHARS